MDPANKQYFTFSGVLSAIISFIINFGLIDLVRGTLIYGFPFNLNGTEGFGNFLFRLLNTAVIGAFLVFPIFYILREMNRRR